MTTNSVSAVTLYTKPTCPYCINAVRLLTEEDISFTQHNYLDLSDDEVAQVQEKTNNFPTVPKIFVGEKFIGGFDQLNKLHQSGELASMLNA